MKKSNLYYFGGFAALLAGGVMLYKGGMYEVVEKIEKDVDNSPEKALVLAKRGKDYVFYDAILPSEEE